MAMKKPKFYQIATNGRTATIHIYGDITSDAEFINSIMETDTGMVSARGIVKEIDALDVDEIDVHINSYGGEVAEALAIFTALRRHAAQVHTFCDGFACSAATIIFCAGDVRTMGPLALMMIHNCSMYLGMATANDMRKSAEDADKINQSSINAYLAVSNLSEDEIRAMMDRETWLTAEECLEYGFATDIAEEDPEEDDPQQSAFGTIRAAILSNREDRITVIEKKLEQLLDVLQKEDEDPEEDPEEDPDKEPDVDPEAEPEEEPEDPDKEKEEPEQKLVSFFSKYIKR